MWHTKNLFEQLIMKYFCIVRRLLEFAKQIYKLLHYKNKQTRDKQQGQGQDRSKGRGWQEETPTNKNCDH